MELGDKEQLYGVLVVFFFGSSLVRKRAFGRFSSGRIAWGDSFLGANVSPSWVTSIRGWVERSVVV